MIKAKIIADSISESGVRITTFELEYCRYIHAQVLTHRLMSRNSASSRAIPVKKVISQVWNDPVLPLHWGKNKPGMQADEELSGWRLSVVKAAWKGAAKVAASVAWVMDKVGLHKQAANRILEPFQYMKVVMTATEWDNFFSLRCHKDAQPEIKALADVMYDVYRAGSPKALREGMWHTPYYGDGWWSEESPHSLEEALAISSSCCAQVSYRVLDDSLEKAAKIFDKLVHSKPVHASPMEHQATPVIEWTQEGVTHMDKQGYYWSGNLRSWVQHRQLLEDHTCWNFSKEK